MGSSQSQEERTNTFSTIGLPPSSLYSGPGRSHSVSVPRGDSSSSRHHNRGHFYRTNDRHSDGDDSDEWLRVDRPSTRTHITQTPLPPIPIQPPPQSHSSSNVPRPSRRPPPPSRSLREFDEYDLEQLLSTLQNLQLTRSQEVSSDSLGSERGDRRRRHHHSSSGRSRHRLRHPGGPFLFLRHMQKVKCPLCSSEFTPPELESHLPICSAKPRVAFNEDKLTQDAGECSICLDDMVAGDEIARLPCLCVYHLYCLKDWYKKSQTCPEHPDMKEF